MPKFYVNQKISVNAKNITEVNKFGADYIVFKDVVPLVDEIVMNNGLYPKAENEKAYASLNGILAPYGHPQLDDTYVSAYDPYAINFQVGAHCENARKKGDKYLVDVLINKDFASRTEKGQELLERIENVKTTGEVIQVSTGLMLDKINKSGTSKGKKYSWIASNMRFDHVAILDEDTPAAGSPDEGVGMFANQSTRKFVVNGKEHDPISDENVTIDDTVSNDENAILKALKSLLNLNQAKQSKPETNEDTDMTPEQIKALTDGIVAGINDANKPLIDAVNSLKANIQANAEKEIEPLKAEVATHFKMDATVVNSMSVDAIKSLHALIKTADTVNTDVQTNSKKDNDKSTASYDINSIYEEKR